MSCANTRRTNLSPCPGKDAFFSRPTDHKAEVQTGDGDICKIEEHPQCIRPILTRSCRGLLTPRYLEGEKNLDVCRQLFSLFLLDTGRPSVQTIQIYVRGFVEKRRWSTRFNCFTLIEIEFEKAQYYDDYSLSFQLHVERHACHEMKHLWTELGRVGWIWPMLGGSTHRQTWRMEKGSEKDESVLQTLYTSKGENTSEQMALSFKSTLLWSWGP